MVVWGLADTIFCGLEAKIGSKTVKLTVFQFLGTQRTKKNDTGNRFLSLFSASEAHRKEKMEF